MNEDNDLAFKNFSKFSIKLAKKTKGVIICSDLK